MYWILACLIAPLLFIVTVPSSSLIDCLQSKGETRRHTFNTLRYYKY